MLINRNTQNYIEKRRKSIEDWWKHIDPRPHTTTSQTLPASSCGQFAHGGSGVRALCLHIQLHKASKSFNRVTKKTQMERYRKETFKVQTCLCKDESSVLTRGAFIVKTCEKNYENKNSMEFHTSQKMKDSVATAPISEQTLPNHPCTRRKRRSLLQPLQHI